MLRLSPKPFLLAAIALAALLPGAALHAQDGEDETPACYTFDLDDLRLSATEADIIVSAEIVSATGEVAVLRPSFYLKGSASAEDIEVHKDTADECPLAAIPGEGRVIAVLREGDNGLAWPGPSQLFTLQDGSASHSASPPVTMLEAELIERIRDVTGQYAVPPTGDEDAASIEWLTTVVPLVVALFIVLGIGLYLMRIWHRIDPS